MDFMHIAFMLVISGLFGIIAKYLKQPLLLGYVFAGIVITASGYIVDIDSLNALAQIGVTLLLFLLGMELNIKELKSVGRVVVITGIGQIVITTLVCLVISLFLGFSFLPAFYISLALTFSSTIIMVKLLSEKKKMSSLYGKIAIGFLLIEDLVAVFILMFLSGLRNHGDFGFFDAIFLIVKVVFLFGAVYLSSKKLLPYIFNKIATSSELLYVVSIAWALGMAALTAGPLGFTPEIGGFLAGIALSNLISSPQIISSTRPLRDFFLVIFFMILGTKLTIDGQLLSLIPYGIFYSLFVLIVNPLVVLIIMGALGYKKKTSFLSGMAVAQISEFSLILMTVGYSLNHVNDREVSIVVLVGIITMTVSTYLILNSEKIYLKIHKFLRPFERRKPKEEIFSTNAELKDHVIIIGADRTGKSLVKYFKRHGVEFVVIDFNPDVFTRLTADGHKVIFGDANETEVFDLAKPENALMVVSTVAESEVDTKIILELKRKNINIPSIFVSHSMSDAKRLYEVGATYVILPESLASEHLEHLLESSKDFGSFQKKGESHFKKLTS